MVILGLLLVILGVIAILSAIFVSTGTNEMLGIEMGSLSVFLVGVAAGAAVLWGYSILKWGTKRSLAHRKERKEIGVLNERLKRAESERHDETPDGRQDKTPDERI
ncbi:hypothetical protein [Nocardioides sp.]|uniref:hypothetical protein n=1 Tax=Nocardioides sp. TaxID=35761 RepID=UPI002B524A61|nr:hypothetical protein [Nocardioides sp.]HXH81122.1 hypothetical protein [Nocardioides sp.]